MNPKQKADQLVNSFIPNVRWKMGQDDVMHRAKQCALIACDEIIKIAPTDKSIVGTQYLTIKEFWINVREELEKI